MSEIKTDLKRISDYQDGDDAFLIEPNHSMKDVLRFVFYDDPEGFMYLAEQVFLEETE